MECRGERARGKLRDRYFLFPSALALGRKPLASITSEVLAGMSKYKQRDYVYDDLARMLPINFAAICRLSWTQHIIFALAQNVCGPSLRQYG